MSDPETSVKNTENIIMLSRNLFIHELGGLFETV